MARPGTGLLSLAALAEDIQNPRQHRHRVAATFNDRPFLAIGAALVALVFFGTALSRSCPLYVLLGISTVRGRRKRLAAVVPRLRPRGRSGVELILWSTLDLDRGEALRINSNPRVSTGHGKPGVGGHLFRLDHFRRIVSDQTVVALPVLFTTGFRVPIPVATGERAADGPEQARRVGGASGAGPSSGACPAPTTSQVAAGNLAPTA